MKKLALVLALGFALISACIIYLLRSGVSIRSAPLIRPSVISEDERNIADAVIIRLVPELRGARYVLWGVLPDDVVTTKLMANLRADFERHFGQKATIIDGGDADEAALRSCPKPCWVLLPRDGAHELEANAFIDSRLRSSASDWISVTYVPFVAGVPVSNECREQKRLTLRCLKETAAHESERKMRKKAERYFFLRRYMERDFFLFVQSAPRD